MRNYPVSADVRTFPIPYTLSTSQVGASALYSLISLPPRSLQNLPSNENLFPFPHTHTHTHTHTKERKGKKNGTKDERLQISRSHGAPPSSLNIDWNLGKFPARRGITRRRIIRSTFQVILCTWRTYLPCGTEPPANPPRGCVYSPRRLCPLCLPPRKETRKFAQFVRAKGRERMDVGTWSPTIGA